MTEPQRERAEAARNDTDELPEHYVETGSSLAERPTRVLKHGDLFAVCDSHGDIGAELASGADSAEGVFCRDARHLSHLRMVMDRRPLLLLSSVIQDDNAALSVDLTNSDIRGDGTRDGPIRIPRDTIYIGRTRFLWRGASYERIALRNFGQRQHRFAIGFSFDADFHDLFEVRGEHRARRGSTSRHVVAPDRTEFRYRGLDGLLRRTVLRFDPTPSRLAEGAAEFEIDLAAKTRCALFLTVSCDDG